MSNITDALEQQAELLYQNVAGWETRTLEYIGARIKKTGRMSMTDVQQLNNMVVVKQDMDVIIKDLARITGQNVSAIEQIYGEVIDSQHNANKALYDYRNKPFVPFKNNRRLQALVKAYSRVTAGTMINLSKTKALGFVDELGRFSNIQDSLYKTLGQAVVEVSSGSTDFNTAMRRTIEQLGGSGIRVDYGSGVTRRLDTVVRQNLLYGAKQASTEYNEMIGEELGCDGIEIDWHSNPRPSHEFMQGKQYSLEGKKTIRGVTYESADAALAALEEYGCLHFKTPIICGVSEPAYSPEQLKELNRKNKEPVTVDGVTKNGYEWKQAMRRLESEARNTKDQLTMFKASGDVEGARKCRVRLKAINEKYNSIADQTGIKAQPEKMRSVGASSGSKVAKNYSKTLENSGRSGILKDANQGSIEITKHTIDNIATAKTPSMSDGLAEKLRTRHKELLKMAAEQPLNTEVGFVCDMDGNHLLKPVIGEIGEGKVRLPSQTKPYITIHNHPSGLFHSHVDFEKFLGNPLQQIASVVGNNGKVYLLVKNKNYDGLMCLMKNIEAKPDIKRAVASKDLDLYIQTMKRLFEECGLYGMEFYI